LIIIPSNRKNFIIFFYFYFYYLIFLIFLNLPVIKNEVEEQLFENIFFIFTFPGKTISFGKYLSNSLSDGLNTFKKTLVSFFNILLLFEE
jgi:hypothetical protein